MSKRIDWPCSVKDGKLIFPDKDLYLSQLAATFGQGEYQCVHTLETLGRSRTAAQLRYLFGPIYNAALLDETFGGWSKDEIHGYFKEKYLRRTRELKGEIVEVAGTTTKLNTAEMTEFVEAVRRELSEMGIYTADPNGE